MSRTQDACTLAAYELCFARAVAELRALGPRDLFPPLRAHTSALLDSAEALCALWMEAMPRLMRRETGAQVDMWAYRAYIYTHMCLQVATQEVGKLALHAMCGIWMYGHTLREAIDGLTIESAVHIHTTASATLCSADAAYALALVGAREHADCVTHAHLDALCADALAQAAMCIDVRTYCNASTLRSRAARAVCLAAHSMSTDPCAIDTVLLPAARDRASQCWIYAAVHAVASSMHVHACPGTPYYAGESIFVDLMMGMHAVGIKLACAPRAARVPLPPPLPWLAEFVDAPALDHAPASSGASASAPMEIDATIDSIYGAA